MSMSDREKHHRKRAGKGRSVERETKRPRFEPHRRSSSDNEATLSVDFDRGVILNKAHHIIFIFALYLR